MSILRLPLIVLTGAALLGGCAEVRPGTAASATERDAAYGLVGQLAALATLAEDPGDGQVLLDATQFSSLLVLTTAPDTVVPLPRRPSDRESSDALRGCLTASGSTATFTECALAEHVVDGNLSGYDDTVAASLIDVFVIGSDVHGSTSVDARLESASSVLRGGVDLDVLWTVGGTDMLVDAELRAEDIAVDDAGCPVGGLLVIRAAVGTDEAQTTHLWFGPTCGDVLLSR